MKSSYDDDRNIHKRIYRFVIEVLKLIKKLQDTPENKVIRYQIAKSVTSMGVNDQEADGASTTKDFSHKYGIVKKEGKETHYWLNGSKIQMPNLKKKHLILSMNVLKLLRSSAK